MSKNSQSDAHDASSRKRGLFAEFLKADLVVQHDGVPIVVSAQTVLDSVRVELWDAVHILRHDLADEFDPVREVESLIDLVGAASYLLGEFGRAFATFRAMQEADPARWEVQSDQIQPAVGSTLH
jgi:hypothetical protein